jgi:hypothetical protein
MAAENERLAPLEELSGYEVAKGEPDPRGWALLARDGSRVGRVHDLIVDPKARQARYLDVLLDEETVLEHHRHILVPAEAFEIGEPEEQEKQITVAATTEELRGLPPFTGFPLTPEQEAQYRAHHPAAGGEARHG